MNTFLEVVFMFISLIVVNLSIMLIAFGFGALAGFVVGLVFPTIFGIKTWILFGSISAIGTLLT